MEEKLGGDRPTLENGDAGRAPTPGSEDGDRVRHLTPNSAAPPSHL